MKTWSFWIAMVVTVCLLTACGDAQRYAKDHYPLVSAEGQGGNLSKVYAVEGKTVPEVAAELTASETPKETSKASQDQMFLLYSDKVVNLQKDPQAAATTTLVQIDSIAYAREHYNSSFLQGYLTAALVQSIFGSGWSGSRTGYDYRGYRSSPSYSSPTATAKPPVSESNQGQKQPSTSTRTGDFKTNKGISGVNTGSGSSGSGSTGRKNDGSTPNKVTKPSTGSKPSTGKRTGSFKRK
ncbi:DUF4247 domain-containing protein [Paenibacillus athensensis]|uniref:DUF4247 domain-containing protein n=2 Tax=Paenibacillus athensensis TaxID=1967502 RepID=A0A4Y8Q9R4_9BACL|nr:DUF4247 domain-containing protein [Paenibacillus athensensis]